MLSEGTSKTSNMNLQGIRKSDFAHLDVTSLAAYVFRFQTSFLFYEDFSQGRWMNIFCRLQVLVLISAQLSIMEPPCRSIKNQSQGGVK